MQDLKTRLAQCAAVGTVIGPNTINLLDDARERIAELETLVGDCMPFILVAVDRHMRDGAMSEPAPVHADILKRLEQATGNTRLLSSLSRK